MLMQFVLVVFAMCAVLSLIVDAGYARITQGQMQIAADTAALEGVRKRDVGVMSPAAGQFVDDPFASDCIRRASANRLVHWVFDDDMNPANGDADSQFGAGPIIDMTDGVTSLHALQTMSVPETHVYKPDLQLNQRDNAARGDMVSGRFVFTDDPVASEDQNYARNDFEPNTVVPQPPGALNACPGADEDPPSPWPLPGSGSLTSADDSAFLVRLRRSNEFAEPDIESTGPALPLVFGKGTMIAGDDPNGGYSVRRDGLTVRATAIAAVRPAMQVGPAQTNPSLPGVTPFALVDTCMPSLGANGTAVDINRATGVITRVAAGPPACPAAAVVGRFVANATAMSRVGRVLPPAVLSAQVAAACATNAFAGFSGYGPVYSPIALGANRIIGFTRIGLGRDPARAPTATTCRALLFHGVSLVAPSNATANLVGGLQLPVGVQPALVAELLDKNRIGPGRVNYGPVLVPVLVR